MPLDTILRPHGFYRLHFFEAFFGRVKYCFAPFLPNCFYAQIRGVKNFFTEKKERTARL